MKKLLLTALSTSLLFFGSCEEDTIVNNEVFIPETTSEAAKTEVTVLFDNNVLIDWEVLEKVEAESIVYDVEVNGEKLGDKISSSSLTIDGNQFKNEDQKEVVLEIFITAFGAVGEDEDQNTLLTYETTEVVALNNAPSQFMINTIIASDDVLMVLFSEPSDLDGDILAFDFFVDEELIAEDISFKREENIETIFVDQSGTPLNTINNGSIFRIGTNQNEFILAYDFTDKLSQDITLKVIAKDKNGGISEAEKVFNIKGSDVDLGVLAINTDNTISVDLDSEVDNAISYFFTLEEATGIRFKNEDDSSLFRTISLLEVDSSSTINIDNEGALVEAGNYEVVITNNFSSSDTIVLETFETDSQDKDLGLLTLPFESNEFIEFFKEVDQSFNYKFQVDEEVDYQFRIEQGFSVDWVLLNDDTGRIVDSEFSDTTFDSNFEPRLAPGNYNLMITRGFSSSLDSFDMEIIIQGVGKAKVSDIGSLALPFSQEYDLDLQNNLFNNTLLQVFEFEVAEDASFLFATDIIVDFSLKNEFGSVINSDSFSRLFESFGPRLQRGKYSLEIASRNSRVPAKLSFNLSDEFQVKNETVINLGLVTVPFTATQSFDFISELTNTLVYTFEITESTSYSIGTGLTNTRIELYEITNTPFDNFIDSGNRGIINANENALSPGIYRIEVDNQNFDAVKGELSIRLE